MTICSLFTRGYPVESWPQLFISAGSPGDRSSQIGHWPLERRCSNAQWGLRRQGTWDVATQEWYQFLGDSRLAEWIKTGLFQQACCGLKQRGLATWPRRMAGSIRKSWRDGLTNKHGYLCITMMKDTCRSCDITPYHTPNSNVNRPPSPAFRGTIVTKFRVVTNQIPWFSQRKWHQPPSLVDSWVENQPFSGINWDHSPTARSSPTVVFHGKTGRLVFEKRIDWLTCSCNIHIDKQWLRSFTENSTYVSIYINILLQTLWTLAHQSLVYCIHI